MKCLKVMIIDDESCMLELIERLIEWDELGLELCAKLSNGIEALECLEKLQPEIIITDIRMPGISGMHFIERAREILPGSTYIVISGYSEFTYAQSALRLEVEDYLLKPIKKTELNDSLERSIEKYRTNTMREEMNWTLKSELKKKNSLLRKDILGRFITSAEMGKDTEFQDENGLFHFSEKGSFSIFVLQLSYFSHLLGENQTHAAMLGELSDEIMGYLEEGCIDKEFVSIGIRTFFVLHYPDGKQFRRVLISRLYEYLKNQKSRYVEAEITIAAGQEVKKSSEFADGYASAKLALNHRLKVGPGNIIDYETLELDHLIDTGMLTEDQEEHLKSLTLSMNAKNLSAYASDLINEFLGKQSGNYEAIYSLSENILETVFQCFPDKTEEQAEFMKKKEIYISQIQCCNNIHEIGRYLDMFLRQIMKEFEMLKEKEDIKPILKAKKYIAQNIDKQISLNELAELSGMTPSYFSTLFKNKTDMPLSNYLIEARLEEGKQLLRTTTLSVKQIAEKVGYADPKHFSKLFIKNVGIKPIEYRKFYS